VSNLPKQHKNDNDDQDDADATMSVAALQHQLRVTKYEDLILDLRLDVQNHIQQ
jgi:hypothetical protein